MHSSPWGRSNTDPAGGATSARIPAGVRSSSEACTAQNPLVTQVSLHYFMNESQSLYSLTDFRFEVLPSMGLTEWVAPIFSGQVASVSRAGQVNHALNDENMT
jgi:hypothetical protein